MRALAVLLVILAGATARATSVDSLIHSLKGSMTDEARVRTLEQVVRELMRSHPDSALGYSREYLARASELGDQRQIARANACIGNCLVLKGDHAKALPYHLEALKRYDQLGDRSMVAMSHGRVAEVYRAEGQRQKALTEFRYAYNGFVALSDTMWQAMTGESLASIFSELGHRDSAYLYFERIALLMEAVGAPEHAAMMRFRQSSEIPGRSNDSLMLVLQQRAYELLGTSNDDRARCTILEGLGTTHQRLGHMTEAEQKFRAALAIAVRSGFKKNRADIHLGLSTLFDRLQLPDSALQHLRSHLQWKDSVYTEEGSARIAEVQGRFDSARKDAELQRRDKLIAEQRTRMAAYLGAALCLLVLVLALVFGWRRDQRSNQLLEQRNADVGAALKEKELLLSELHHRVKNNMQVVGSLLRLQARDTDDAVTRRALQEAMMRVKSLALVHQNLYRGTSLPQVPMDTYVSQLAHGLLRSHGMGDRVTLDLQVAAIRLDVDSAIPLGLILNELVTNALKHAFPGDREGRIKVELRDEGGSLIVEVSDDGVGFDPSTKRPPAGDAMLSGAGIVGTFAGTLGADWVVENGHGTTVRLAVRNFTRA